jgi:hypothetical protein
MNLERIRELINPRPDTTEETDMDVFAQRIPAVSMDDILYELGSEGVYFQPVGSVAVIEKPTKLSSSKS